MAAKKYKPDEPTWVKVSLNMHIQNPPPETKYLGEAGSIGRAPLELSELLYHTVLTIAEFWSNSVGGTDAELNEQMDKFRKMAAGVRYIET